MIYFECHDTKNIYSYFVPLLDGNQSLRQSVLFVSSFVLWHIFCNINMWTRAAPLLCYHVKYLAISHIWQLWHIWTFERLLNLTLANHLVIQCFHNLNISIFICDFVNHEKFFALSHFNFTRMNEPKGHQSLIRKQGKYISDSTFH